MKAGFTFHIISTNEEPLRSIFHGQKACRDGVCVGGVGFNITVFVEITFLDELNDFKIFIFYFFLRLPYETSHAKLSSYGLFTLRHDHPGKQ